MSGQSQEPTLSPTYNPGSPTPIPTLSPTSSPTYAAWTDTDTIVTSVVVGAVAVAVIVILYTYHLALVEKKAGYDMVPTHDHEHARGAEPGESKPLQEKAPAAQPPRAQV